MKQKPIRHILTRLVDVFAIVLLWRGIWVILDQVDKAKFGGNHIGSAIVGIIVGSIILYFVDRDITIV